LRPVLQIPCCLLPCNRVESHIGVAALLKSPFPARCSFSTQDTCPGGRPWVDAIQMVDGHFSPDGASLAVTDVAGQLHIYGLGGRDNLRCAPLLSQSKSLSQCVWRKGS